MVKDVVSIKPDDNAYEALKLLFKKRISGLPVIDAQGKLVGMFTEKDVLKYILPSYLDRVGKFVYEENPKAVGQKILSLSGLKVKDLMRQDVVTVDEDATLCEIAHLMLTQKARRIPVLNRAKAVTGIVAREDILKALFAEYVKGEK
jgi:CBS domain-containing protein